LLTTQLEPKRLGLLRDLVPGVAVIGALINPSFPPAVHQLRDLQNAAGKIGQELVVAKASTDMELHAALASLVGQRVGALMVASSPYFDTRRDQIINFAAQSHLPAIYSFRELAASGGLISYGPKITDGYQQAGI
jgi:putative tryptophan/tyrosine transport system substrate-binding protein